MAGVRRAWLLNKIGMTEDEAGADMPLFYDKARDVIRCVQLRGRQRALHAQPQVASPKSGPICCPVFDACKRQRRKQRSLKPVLVIGLSVLGRPPRFLCDATAATTMTTTVRHAPKRQSLDQSRCATGLVHHSARSLTFSQWAD